MSDIYKNRSVDLTTTDVTTVYTVPTANATTVPPQKPVQAIIKSIRVCKRLRRSGYNNTSQYRR